MSSEQFSRRNAPTWRPPVIVAAVALAACASAPLVNWPAPLEPAGSERWSMTLAARGVQIYACRGDGSSGAWVFVAPEAELFDDARRPVGRHGAGPFWQATDGSRIDGTLQARADAPDADAIPWLLVSTRSTGPSGRFSAVTSVRRAHTVGGSAPRSGCGPDMLGATARVPYAADYVFYTGGAVNPRP